MQQAQENKLERTPEVMQAIENARREILSRAYVEQAAAVKTKPSADEVKKYFRERVYKTIIPRNIRLSEAPSHGLSIIDYDARSRGSEVYLELAKEVLAHGE